MDLDHSGHVVAGVVPDAAALAEEQDAGDQCENGAGDADEESPEEHHFVVVEADVLIVVHEPAVHSDANHDADSCNTSASIQGFL